MKNTFVSAAHFFALSKILPIRIVLYLYLYVSKSGDNQEQSHRIYKTKYSFCTTFAHLRRSPPSPSSLHHCIVHYHVNLSDLSASPFFLLLLLMRTRWESRTLFVFLLLFAALKRCLKALERNRKKTAHNSALLARVRQTFFSLLCFFMFGLSQPSLLVLRMEFFIIFFSREDFASFSSFSFLLCSYKISLFFLLVVPLPLSFPSRLMKHELKVFRCGLDNSGTLYLVLDWISADLHTSSIVSFSPLLDAIFSLACFAVLVWCFMVLFFMIFQAVFWWAPLSIREGKSSSLKIYFSSCQYELASRFLWNRNCILGFWNDKFFMLVVASSPTPIC